MEVEAGITIYGAVQPKVPLSVVDGELEQVLDGLGVVARRIDDSEFNQDHWTIDIELEFEKSLSSAFRLILDVLECHEITLGAKLEVFGNDFTIAEVYEKLTEPSPDWWNLKNR